MNMQPLSIAVVGSPLGAWALFGCLILNGVDETTAVVAALSWGVFWICVARIGIRRSGHSASMLGGAIVTSLFLPLPVYLLTLAAAWLNFVPVTVGLPMFATLCSAAPVLFWMMALKPRRRYRASEPIMVMQFTQYDPRLPEGSIPPRNSTIRRAV